MIRRHAAALAIYAVLAVLLIGHGASLQNYIYGISSDPLSFIWCLAWWPHALLHHLDPLHASLVWQPDGLDLVWTTCVPFLALAAAPLTLLAGPMVSYNVLTTLAPLLAAISAYALCLYITRNRAAAFCGGLAYGFSSYEMAEALEHLNLDFTAFVPAMVLVVLARLDDHLSRFTAAALFALALAAEFYTSIEVALTSLVFGGLTWGLAVALCRERRARLLRLVPDGLFAGGLALPLLAPFLWDMLTKSRLSVVPPGWSIVTSAHVFNQLVTTPANVLYVPGMKMGASGLFGLLPQRDFITGLPLLLVIILFWRERRKEPAGKLVLYLLLILVVASLGPQLWVGDVFTGVVMPWALALHLPLLGGALPGRFALYVSLVLAVILAGWVASARSNRRAIAAGLACAVTLAPPHPVTPAPYEAFFRPGRVEAVLGPRARLLVLPRIDETMGGLWQISDFWQAENDFGFAQVTGHFGFPPITAMAHEAVREMAFGRFSPHFAIDVAELCQATKTQYVVAGPSTPPDMVAGLRALGWASRQVDDVTVFTVPAAP
ncbi:MAG: YfhO family protein [Acidocella sp.]